MPSTFFGLNISTSGLYAASTNLNVTANNAANAATKGYSRQEATQVAKNALRVYQEYGMIGAGVNVTSIDRVRDSFYDHKYWSNQSNLGSAQSKYYYMQQVENHLNEFQVDGFTLEYQNMFASMEDLKNDPSNLSARTAFLNYSESLMNFLEQVKTNLKLVQEDLNAEVSDDVDKINTISTDIAALNKQINIVELTGTNANELRDQRDLLIDQLTQICEVQTSETVYENGKTEYVVKLGTATLVDNYHSYQLQVASRQEKTDPDDVVGLYDIQWSNGQEFNPVKDGLEGTLKGLLEVRDGNNGLVYAEENADDAPVDSTTTATVIGESYPIDYKGVVYYIDEITKFQRAFAEAVNEVHGKGENLYGNSTRDIPIFIEKEGSVFGVNQDLLLDPSLMATCYDITDGVGSQDLITDMLELRDAKILENANSEGFLQSLVTEIAVDVKKQYTLQSSYEAFQQVIDNQRLSIMGVDKDEEAMNLVKFQEAFDLNSKVIDIFQEIYEKLINGTGV